MGFLLEYDSHNNGRVIIWYIIYITLIYVIYLLVPNIKYYEGYKNEFGYDIYVWTCCDTKTIKTSEYLFNNMA